MKTVPQTKFQTRVRNDAIEGPNPFEWKEVFSHEIFKDRNVVLFALPGAFDGVVADAGLKFCLRWGF